MQNKIIVKWLLTCWKQIGYKVERTTKSGNIIKLFTSNVVYEVAEDGTIVIQIDKLFNTVEDVMTDNEDAVYILIRNDKTRNSRLIGIPGLRVLATYYSRVKHHNPKP